MPDLFQSEPGSIATMKVKQFNPSGWYTALVTISRVYRATGFEDADAQAAAQLLLLAEKVVEELKRRVSMKVEG
jgi:diadenosine tetraphosphate (Ap4A) HIT family hydrolase